MSPPTGAFVIAHRGASFDANENCASAIRLARAMGAARVEVDVHLARDGTIVVHHDDDLMRGGGDPRRIDSLALADLRAVRQQFDPRFQAGEPLLTLAEALDLAAPLPLVVEVKGDERTDAPRVRTLARGVAARLAARRDEASSVISFERAAVEEAAAALGQARAGLIRNGDYGPDGWRDLLSAPGSLAVLSRKIATEAMVAELLAVRKEVWVYALDDEAGVRRYAAAGVRGIISNRPDRALAALAPG